MMLEHTLCSIDLVDQLHSHSSERFVCRFAFICRSGTWDKQHGVDVERRRLLSQTRDLVNKGLQSEHEWHTVSHADYARPMLQVRHVINHCVAHLQTALSFLAWQAWLFHPVFAVVVSVE